MSWSSCAAAAEIRRQISRLHSLGWYHSIRLHDGSVIEGLQTLSQLQQRLARFPVPADLRGKRVLDIGAWDGWFSFEMERRGAEVVALDRVKSDTFLQARALLESKVKYVIGDICHMPLYDIGQFDIVLFLGVLYHLRHPVLALERVCSLSRDLVCLESYVIQEGSRGSSPPFMEFYEGAELAGQFDNWIGPTTECLLAMARSAGFSSVTLESVVDQRAHVTCRVKWDCDGQAGPAPLLLCVENTISRDHSFCAHADDYISLWFTSGSAALTCGNVYAQVGSFAARPLHVNPTDGGGWVAVCRVPRGLRAGWHDARVRMAESAYSNPIRIPIDLTDEEKASRPRPPVSSEIAIEIVTDGRTWQRAVIQSGANSSVSLWARGVPAVRSGLMVTLGSVCLAPAFVSLVDKDGLTQINAMVPAGIPPGPNSLILECNGVSSAPVAVDLV